MMRKWILSDSTAQTGQILTVCFKRPDTKFSKRWQSVMRTECCICFSQSSCWDSCCWKAYWTWTSSDGLIPEPLACIKVTSAASHGGNWRLAKIRRFFFRALLSRE
ncbi:hypothetical protein LEMLEM_LOCUS2232, partial [Lemmus lemmus]